MLARLFLSACLLLWPLSINGQLVFNESFTYSDGALATNSGGIWLHNSGTENSMLTRDGQLEVSFARTEDILAPLPGGPFRVQGPTVAIYTSFRINFFALPNQTGSYFAHLTGENPLTHRGRIWAATTTVDGSPAGPGSFYIGIGNNTPSASVPRAPGSGQFPIPLTTNYWYTIVTRYELGSSQASIWLDPQSEADRPSTADDFVVPEDFIDVTYLAFRQATGIGAMRIDDIRVGTTFSSVAGANTAPLVSTIPSQNIPAGGSTGTLSFEVSDSETSAESLLVTTSSSNPELVPNENILLTGSGRTRFLTLQSAPQKEGLCRILITVSDGVNSSLSEFIVRVGYPSISAISDQIISGTNALPEIGFTVTDDETPAEQLQVGITVSNPALLPQKQVSIKGTGSSRAVCIQPVPGQFGTSLVTLTVSDGVNETSTSFAVTIGPALGLLVDESFAYQTFSQPNSLYMAQGSSWISASGTPFQTQVTNGWVYLDRTKTEDLALPLLNGPYEPTNNVMFYTSFLVRFTELPSDAGSYFLHFRNSETGISFRGRVFAITSGAVSNHFRLGISNSGNVPTDFPADLTLSSEHSVVTRYNSLTGVTTLWVDPISEQSPCVSATDAPAPDRVSHIALRQNTGIGALSLGHLKVGTTFLDVLGTQAPAPVRLVLGRSGAGLILEWPDPSFSLCTSPHAAGPFTKVSGAHSPFTLTPSTEPRFFRLVYP